MLVVEVDAADAEPAEAALACRAHVSRVAAHRRQVRRDAELGGELHLLPHLTLQRRAEEDLIGVRSVDVGGVEEGDPRGDGRVEERHHVGPWLAALRLRLNNMDERVAEMEIDRMELGDRVDTLRKAVCSKIKRVAKVTGNEDLYRSPDPK